jgi:hypothetical protein
VHVRVAVPVAADVAFVVQLVCQPARLRTRRCHFLKILSACRIC